MQLLLDSAMIDEARQAAEWGWVSGATTNPTLLAKSDLPPAITLKQLGIFFKGSIFYQLTGETVELMTEEARLVEDLLGKQLVLKIPATTLGFQVAACLTKVCCGDHLPLYARAGAPCQCRGGTIRVLLSQSCKTFAAGWRRPCQAVDPSIGPD